MPIGSDLNTTFPAVGDSPSVAAAAIIDTLDKLVDAVEASVPVSALDANASLDMDGHAISGVAYVGMDNEAAIETTPGRLHRYGDDLYWVHTTGSVKITDGTGLNASGIGGIGGDFGAGPEYVDYDAALDRYEFFDGPGDMSSVMGDKVILKTSTGECTLTTDTATDVTYTLPAAPASDGLMQATTAGAISVSPTVAPRITFTIFPNHGEVEVIVPLSNFESLTGSWAKANGKIIATGASTMLMYLDVPVGSRIKELHLRMSRSATAGTASIKLVHWVESGADVLTKTDIGTAATSASTTGFYNLDKTGLTQVVATDEQYAAEIALPATNDYVRSLTVVIDRAI